MSNLERNAVPRDAAMNRGEMLLQTLEGIKEILESVDLYRDECLRHGYSPTAAEQMALGFHALLLLHAGQQVGAT